MRLLASFDRKDYEAHWPHTVRKSAHGIIIRDKKVGLMYMEKFGCYIFPGGGVEEGEAARDTLVREVREEAGLIVRPSSIQFYGMAVEKRKDSFARGIYERNEHYFTCDVEEKSVTKKLTEEELYYGHEFMYTSFDEAISANEIFQAKGNVWTETVTAVLKLLRSNCE